jgi:hypothetical protein
MRKRWLCTLLIGTLVGIIQLAGAVELLEYLTDKNGQYVGPTVEDNVAKMDTDNNGFADVYEVRAFLELKHGAGYQKAILDKWEVLANSKSCGTSFAEELTE